MDLSTISNVLYGYFNNKRNKLIWTGSLEDLKALALTEIDENTAQSTTWRSPSGGKWSFESKVLSITWHSKSKYIYFGGEKGNDLLEQIQSFLKQNENVSDNGGIDESRLQKALDSLVSDESDDESIADDTSQNLPSRPKGAGKNLRNQHGKQGETASKSEASKYETEEPIIESTNKVNNIRKESVNLHTPTIPDNTTCTGNLHNVNCNKMDHLPEIKEINSKLEEYMQNVNSKFEALSEEISTIKDNKENKAYAILVLEEIIADLRKEKQEVNRENDELREKNRNLFHSLSETRGKVIELQDEKSSLITALRLMQREQATSPEKKKIEDLETENENLRAAARALQEDIDKSRKRNKEFMKTTKQGGNAPITQTDAPTSFETKNQYVILSNSDQEEAENISVLQPTLSTKQPEADKQDDDVTESKNATKNSKSKPNILLIGDSMIKDINPHKLSKSSVRKLTYPGKRAEEIADQIESAHVHSPPTEVIIHAGTNNLITDSSRECFDHIQSLISNIKKRFNGIRIGISSLIMREDIDVTSKIKETNELLKDLCLKEGYTYIENVNIDATCLNGSKLHLNSKGSVLLAVHFIKFLRGRNPRSSIGDFPKGLRKLGELLNMIMPHQKTKKRSYR